MARTFPLYLKNQSGGVLYIGNRRYAHNEVRSIDEGEYETLGDEIERLLKSKSPSGLKFISVVETDAGEDAIQIQVESAKLEKERENRSIVALFVDREVDWREAADIISALEDVEQIKALLKEAEEGGLKPTSSVVKRLTEQLEIYGD